VLKTVLATKDISLARLSFLQLVEQFCARKLYAETHVGFTAQIKRRLLLQAS
jgi:hypothetical protein